MGGSGTFCHVFLHEPESFVAVCVCVQPEGASWELELGGGMWSKWRGRLAFLASCILFDFILFKLFCSFSHSALFLSLRLSRSHRTRSLSSARTLSQNAFSGWQVEIGGMKTLQWIV